MRYFMHLINSTAVHSTNPGPRSVSNGASPKTNAGAVDFERVAVDDAGALCRHYDTGPRRKGRISATDLSHVISGTMAAASLAKFFSRRISSSVQ